MYLPNWIKYIILYWRRYNIDCYRSQHYNMLRWIYEYIFYVFVLNRLCRMRSGGNHLYCGGAAVERAFKINYNSWWQTRFRLKSAKNAKKYCKVGVVKHSIMFYNETDFTIRRRRRRLRYVHFKYVLHFCVRCSENSTSPPTPRLPASGGHRNRTAKWPQSKAARADATHLGPACTHPQPRA